MPGDGREDHRDGSQAAVSPLPRQSACSVKTTPDAVDQWAFTSFNHICSLSLALRGEGGSTLDKSVQWPQSDNSLGWECRGSALVFSRAPQSCLVSAGVQAGVYSAISWVKAPWLNAPFMPLGLGISRVFETRRLLGFCGNIPEEEKK